MPIYQTVVCPNDWYAAIARGANVLHYLSDDLEERGENSEYCEFLRASSMDGWCSPDQLNALKEKFPVPEIKRYHQLILSKPIADYYTRVSGNDTAIASHWPIFHIEMLREIEIRLTSWKFTKDVLSNVRMERMHTIELRSGRFDIPEFRMILRQLNKLPVTLFKITVSTLNVSQAMELQNLLKASTVFTSGTKFIIQAGQGSVHEFIK